MSDLISRSELLKRFLVSKDGHRIQERDCDNLEVTVSIKDVKTIIKEQPTAYDIDKVVDELEEMIHPKQLYFCKYARGGCKHLDNNDKDCMECIVENAIEIVKQGGVYDDVCEWKLEDDNLMTGCGDYFNLYDNCTGKFKYCPRCGKKIKVVE